MHKYHVQFSAYKPSGKFYSGAKHDLGSFEKYPASEVFKTIEEKIKDLDAACALAHGAVEACDHTVVYLVLDNSDDPICMSGIIRHSGKRG